MSIDKEPTTQIVIQIPSDSDQEEIPPKRGRTKRFGNKKRNSRNKSARRNKRRFSDVEVWTKEEKVEDDDDCVILTSDPLADVDDVSKEGLKKEGSDDDEVAVVAQRGKIACRDFPHPRHTCAEFPFDKTSHENYCSNCFCYVCDIAAPCKYWKEKEGHCNASSSDKNWNSKRKTWRSLQKCSLNLKP